MNPGAHATSAAFQAKSIRRLVRFNGGVRNILGHAMQSSVTGQAGPACGASSAMSGEAG